MSNILVTLDRLLANPWQTRSPRDGDDAHVQELAADIRARGLLQVPLGRLLDGAGHPIMDLGQRTQTELAQLAAHSSYRVQLAFGHNRLAAYRLLATQEPGNGWDKMPVRIAALDDQAMALAAWSENAARKDLSPLEAAQALQRLATDFGWTQEQVGERCGLARATVANKLRLLRLPAELQKKLHAGDLSERQALALLPIYELPEPLQERLQEQGGMLSWEKRQLGEVLAHPEKKSSGEVRDVVRNVVRGATHPLVTSKEKYDRAGFPVEREIAGVAAPACLECPNRLQETRCADRNCYDQKQAAFERQELAFAAAATGLPVITSTELMQVGWAAQSMFWPDDLVDEDANDGSAALRQAVEHHCPNLHLCYADLEDGRRGVSVSGYPNAIYICIHPGQNVCSCKDAGAEERAAARAAAEAQHKEEAKRLFEATVKELTRDLREQDLGALRAVRWALLINDYATGSRDHAVKTPDLGTLCEQIARTVLKKAVRWDAYGVDVAADLAAWREKVGWPA